MMNILHLSTTDIAGGAARAAYRLHRGLLQDGIDSRMLVSFKGSADPRVFRSCVSRIAKGWAFVRPHIDALPLELLHRKRPRVDFRLAWISSWLLRNPVVSEADIINLHWICDGFIRPETLPCLRQPLVWTLHDMWPFTGGCHYSDGCENYMTVCGRCPQLASSRKHDLAYWVWKRKEKAYSKTPLTVVTPSHWLAECARKSRLFGDTRIEIIPYGLDTNTFKPVDKNHARHVLNLPLDKKIILLGGLNSFTMYRKGFEYGLQALEYLASSSPEIAKELLVLIFGDLDSQDARRLPLETHYLGRLHDEASLSLAYNAADLFVAPSLEDNFPNVVLESLACGTPVVAFHIGGMPDMIDHCQNGYLAASKDPVELAEGMRWVLGDAHRYQRLSTHAREKVAKEYALEIQAQRYRQLYEELLEKPCQG